jgi:amino acid transporter
MMGNINSHFPTPVYNRKRIGLALIVFLMVFGMILFVGLLCLMSFASGHRDTTTLVLVIGVLTIGILMALVWLIGLAYLYVSICKRIRTLEERCGLKNRASQKLTILFFFLTIAQLYLQWHYNKCVALLCDKPTSRTLDDP